MVARHAVQALPLYHFHVLAAGAVIQHGGRLHRLQLQVYLYAVALVGADARARSVEGEALLVVARNYLLQFLSGDAEIALVACLQQRVYRHPAARLKREAQRLRGMSQVLAEVFGTNNYSVSHCFPLHQVYHSDPWQTRNRCLPITHVNIVDKPIDRVALTPIYCSIEPMF